MADGELMKPDYIDRNFSKIITDNNFKKIRLHDLRHSCATLLLRNGVPMEEIQKWLKIKNMLGKMLGNLQFLKLKPQV